MKRKIEVGKCYRIKGSEKHGLIPIAVDDEFVTISQLYEDGFKISMEDWILDMDEVADEDKNL